jgi:hypothetical protein
MSEQPGNRAATYPKTKEQKYVPIEQNPLAPCKGEGSAEKGGAPEWESHPQPENTFKKHTT